MIKRTIDKNAITAWLDRLLKTYQVFAPTDRDGILGFEPLASSDEVVLDFGNSRQAPKAVFFPRSETLFTYRDGRVSEVPLVEEMRVVFGIRPCDARSAVLLDMVFNTPEQQDPYYANRREHTVLVGLACDRPLSTCFCTSVGGGPFSVEGLDVLLTDLGDQYLVEAITEKGEALIAGGPGLLPATDEDVRRKAEIASRSERAVSGPNVQGVKEKLDTMYGDPFWDELHLKCLGCAVCTYLCPTCHCFDIVDEGDRSRGQRVRNWDTCQFALFTHHASGHNPRPSGKERMRQRVMHKFDYFVENFGAIACVGCGRCVRECPVNLDIRATLEAIQRVEERDAESVHSVSG
jgi:sulfhydrogenase subunit beta (sulfur reductase)